MPAKALSSPASPAASQTPNVVTNDATNFQIKLPGFLAGVVSIGVQGNAGSSQLSSAALQLATAPGPSNCEIIAEIEVYPGDFVPLYLTDPSRPEGFSTEHDSDAGFAGSLRGIGKTGFAKCGAARSVRIRRIDMLGGQVNVSADFRESVY